MADPTNPAASSSPVTPPPPPRENPLDPAVEWARNYQTFDEYLGRALEQYTLGMDKQVSVMAAYKAMGLDPLRAPLFGWGNQTVDGTNIPSSPPANPVPATPAATGPMPTATTSPVKPSHWLKRLGIGAAAVSLPVLGYGLGTWRASPSAPPTAGLPAGYQYQLEVQQPDGTWKAMGPATRLQNPAP